MPSLLPTDPAGSKAVDTFGIGTYDSMSDEDQHGEDDESREPAGATLPDGGPPEGFDIDFWLSYPQETALGPKHASGLLPGDPDRPPPGPRPADGVLDPLAGPPSDVRISDSGIPSDSGNPPARSDYYDSMTIGESSGLWPKEDSGAYVNQEVKRTDPDVPLPYVDGDGQYVGPDGSIETIPTPETNDVSMDDFLGALGNAWSGFVVEDQAVPYGFPSEEFQEEADFLDENPLLPEVFELQPFGYTTSGDAMSTGPSRLATDLKLVGSLTEDFLKAYGKKNLVRRHVLAFLQERGLPQYLASDVVRCLKHRHRIVIPDVMDVFPLSRTASDGTSRLARAHDALVELSIEHAHEPEVASVLRRCAASVAHALALSDRMEGLDG